MVAKNRKATAKAGQLVFHVKLPCTIASGGSRPALASWLAVLYCGRMLPFLGDAF